MDPDLAGLSRSIDPAVLGRRIRNARIAAGLTQGELAGDSVSTAYISRIEAGQRRPEIKLLGKLAARANTSAEELILGLNQDQRASLRLELDYADLELRSGTADKAWERSTTVIDALDGNTTDDLLVEARLIRALALEGMNQTDEAIAALEDLVAQNQGDRFWTKAAMSLTRCFRDSGDLARAIGTGDAATKRLNDLGLAGSDETIQLALTTASAYFEAGDIGHAVRMCRRASDSAEELGSPRAKASAYWNASIMESSQGHIDAAIPLARQAIELMEQANEHLSIALLHNQLGTFLLAADPPQADEAKELLTSARAELAWSAASPTERAHNAVSLAHACLMTNDLDSANALLKEALEGVDESASILRGRGLALLGQIAFANQDPTTAKHHYEQAVHVLTGAGVDRRVSQLWFELGALLEEVNDTAGASDAYRRAAASTGLSIPTGLRTSP